MSLDMEKVFIHPGDGNIEGHYQRLEILEEVKKNLVKQGRGHEYIDLSINFHKQCIKESEHGR